jgi:hypothetical protein
MRATRDIDRSASVWREIYMPVRRTSTVSQGGAIKALFEDIASRGYDPLLHGAVGCLRLDLTGDGATEQFFVTVNKGAIGISKKRAGADAVVNCDRALFDQMAEGKVNAMAAILRGEMHVDGDLGLVTAFSRLLPGPPASLKSFQEREKRISK